MFLNIDNGKDFLVTGGSLEKHTVDADITTQPMEGCSEWTISKERDDAVPED
jgi:hypothetical protein